MGEHGIGATLNVFDFNLTHRINEAIESKGEFTTVTDTDPTKILPIAIGLLCLDCFPIEGRPLAITHIAAIKKGRRVATGQNILKVSEIVALDSISLDVLLAHLPKNLQYHGENAFSIGYKKVGEKVGSALLKAVIDLCPDNKEQIERIMRRIYKSYPPISDDRKEDLAVEKDATLLCLDIFGIDRVKALREWDSGQKNVGESFLNGFGKTTLYEDDLVNHDLRNLPGWTIIQQHIAGYVEFENAEKERLLIINANRKPLEKAFGVDLVYFHRKYEAFTLVQYKMMDRSKSDSKDLYYNPNQPSHHEELQRMQALYGLLSVEPWSERLNDYRLASCPIFFKLCKKVDFNPDTTSIVPGAYIPLNQWEVILEDESIKGPLGGKQIGYHTLGKRYLGTKVFVELVQNGFIGTQSVISGKIGPYMEDAIRNGHSIVFAVDQRTKISNQYA